MSIYKLGSAREHNFGIHTTEFLAYISIHCLGMNYLYLILNNELLTSALKALDL